MSEELSSQSSGLKRCKDKGKDERKEKQDEENPAKKEKEKEKIQMDPLEPGPVDIQIDKDPKGKQSRKRKHQSLESEESSSSVVQTNPTTTEPRKKKKPLYRVQRPGVGGEAHVEFFRGKDISLGTVGFIEMIDTFDRPGNTFAVGVYSGAGKFAEAFTDKPGQRIPKAGVYAGAGVGHARAEFSVFDAEARGPNVGIGAGASAATLSARAFATAELASASATAGPLKATVGAAVDTGVGLGLTGVEVKFLGTGFSVGRKMGFSLFGTGLEISL